MNLNSQHFTVTEDSFYDHRFWVVDDTGDQWAMGPGLDSALGGAAALLAKLEAGEAAVPPQIEANPQIKAPRPLASMIGEQVRVYRNAKLKTWSVQYQDERLRPNGRVVTRWRVAGHDRAVCLINPRFGFTNDGAPCATGKLATFGSMQPTDLFYRMAGVCKQRISYKPRTPGAPTFARYDTGAAVATAGYAFLDGAGHLYIDRTRS